MSNIVDTVSLLAYRNQKPADSDLTIPEWLLWFRLRDVYRECGSDAERGQKEKEKVLKRFELDRSHWVRVSEVYKLLSKMWKDIEEPARRFAFDQTVENAVKFFEAVYRVPIKDQLKQWEGGDSK